MIAVKLAAQMRANGFTHADGRLNPYILSARAGISYSQAYKLLNNDTALSYITLAMLDCLCDAFHCTPGDLLSYTPNYDPSTPAPQTRTKPGRDTILLGDW